MNTPNNKRRKDSQQRIERAFVQLLQTKEFNEITVTQLCTMASVNRTTFYANYQDVYDLADKLQRKLEQEVENLYDNPGNHDFTSANYLTLFRHIKENQLFYKTYFKLGADHRFRLVELDLEEFQRIYGMEHLEYHIEFFRNGLNAVLKMWLDRDCLEDPEVIAEIIRTEYLPRT